MPSRNSISIPRPASSTFHATVTVNDRPLSPAIEWGPAVGDVGENSRYVKKAEGLLLEAKGTRLDAERLRQATTYEGTIPTTPASTTTTS